MSAIKPWSSDTKSINYDVIGPSEIRYMSVGTVYLNKLKFKASTSVELHSSNWYKRMQLLKVEMRSDIRPFMQLTTLYQI